MRIDQINSSTYKIAHHSHSETEIGDINESVFRPHIKCKRWGGESWISFLHSAVQTITPVLENDILKWITPQLEIWFYSIDDGTHLKELGGMEFEIVLKQKPPTNTFTLNIDYNNVVFCYQRPLTLEEIAAGDIRPDYAVGSYAMFNPLIPQIGNLSREQREKYRIGIIGNILRPKVYDATDNWVWVEQLLDPVQKTITYTIPQSFIDDATYPIRIDPTIGYTTNGTSSTIIADYIRGFVGTTDTNGGTITTISAEVLESSESGHKFKCACYKDSDSSLVENSGTNELEDISTSATWRDFTPSGTATLLASTDYIPVVWANSPGAGSPYIRYTESVAGGHYQGVTYGSWPTSCSFTQIDRAFGVHADYTTPGVIAPVGTVTNASGRGHQNHLIYAENSARWWMFYVDSTDTNVLKCKYSSDLSTWSDGTSKTLAKTPYYPNIRGTNFAVAYKNISGYDVLHFAIDYAVLAAEKYSYHLRATISDTTITWGTEVQITSDTASYGYYYSQVGCLITEDNYIIHLTSFYPSYGADCNPGMYKSSNADSGSSWTSGWPAWTDYGNYVNFGVGGHCGALLSSNGVVTICDNGDGGADGLSREFWYAKLSGTTWTPTRTGILSAPIASPYLNTNDWSAVGVTTTDIHLVVRTDSNSFEHRRFNGSTWSAGDSITDQDTKSGAGFFLVTNGTNVWLFVIDSDANNTVRYCKWTTSGWGSWTALETSSKTRNFISGFNKVVSSKIAVIWSEVNGSNYDVRIKTLDVGGGEVPPVPTTYKSQVFTETGNFAVPSNVTCVWVSIVGAGGAGGGGAAFNNTTNNKCTGGGGGGGGEAIYKFPVTVSSGNIVVTIGAGGTGGGGGSGNNTTVNNGSNGTGGGNSNFGSYIIVKGGNLGEQGKIFTSSSGNSLGGNGGGVQGGSTAANGNSYIIGAGGAGGGLVNANITDRSYRGGVVERFSGGNNGTDYTATKGGGGGGASLFGGGGNGGAAANDGSGNGSNGLSGANYGGGGGGGGAYFANGNTTVFYGGNGGNGGNGYCIIEWYG